MQQPTGVAPPSHEFPRDGNESRGYDSQKALINTAETYGHESAQSHQVHSPMNGEMSQQQVYVSSGIPAMPPGTVAMNGLENQFQSLGFKQEDSIGTDQLSSSAPNSESNNPDETEIEGEEYDEDPPLKLFVGQVRETCVDEWYILSLLTRNCSLYRFLRT